MKAFWGRLSDREKLFVGAGGALAALVILLQLIISPAAGWRSNQSDRRERAEDLYRLVSEASASAGVAAASAGVDLETPILTVLTQSTGGFQIIVNYRNGRSDGGVDANVAAKPDKLFAWLRAIEAKYAVTVAAADIARSANGEDVQAQLTLIRRAAR